jgi:hypothetical protein
VVDFSSVEDSSVYFAPAPGSQLPWRAYSPWTGALSPSGAKLLMLNDLTGVHGAVHVAAAADGRPARGWQPPSTNRFPRTVTRSSRASNGLMLLYGLLLTVDRGIAHTVYLT